MTARRSLVVLLLGGCSSLPALLSQSNPTTEEPIVAAAEDGSQYVRVQGGATSSSASVLRDWKRTAEKACDGDYMVVSDAAFERKRAGLVVSRTHEGYVRCIVGDPERMVPDGDVRADQRLGSR